MIAELRNQKHELEKMGRELCGDEEVEVIVKESENSGKMLKFRVRLA